MKMRRNIYFFILAALTLIISGCNNSETEPKTEAISLTVRVSEISYNNARLTVKHNGPEDITWYGFMTNETNRDEFDLFIEKYNELLSSGDFSGLRREQERNILIENLEENTSYKYIAFAMKETGELYENVGMGYMEFSTSKNIYILTQTNDWELNYLGRNEDRTRELIEVVAKKGGRFGWNYISKESIEAWNEENPDGFELWVDDIYMTTVDAFQMYALQQISTVQYYMSMGYALDELTYTYIAGSPFDIERLPSGEYYLIAYGFEGNGSHTQTYSVTEVTLEEEAATEEYLNWLGTYRFTGEADVTDSNGEVKRKEISYNITIEEYDNNYMYRVKGWECGNDVKYDWEEDIMQLDKEKGEFLAFPAYYQNGSFIVKENPMTYITFDGQTQLLLGIYGYAFSETDNQEIPVIWDESMMGEPAVPMAIAEPIAAGETTTTLIGQKATAWSVSFEYCKMGYLAWNQSTGAYQTINPAMRFPITMTKIADASADQGTVDTPSMSSKGVVTFSTNVISDDFLRKDFSKLEKVKPQIFDRYLK